MRENPPKVIKMCIRDRGAAAIAACGAGIYPSYADAARTMVHTETVYEPDAAEAADYAQQYGNYLDMWEHMQAYYRTDRN